MSNQNEMMLNDNIDNFKKMYNNTLKVKNGYRD